MALKQYKLRVRAGEEPPDEWSRFLLPFADGGLRLKQTFVMECVVEAGPVTIENMKQAMSDYIEFQSYDGSHTEKTEIFTDKDEDYKWWRKDG